MGKEWVFLAILAIAAAVALFITGETIFGVAGTILGV